MSSTERMSPPAPRPSLPPWLLRDDLVRAGILLAVLALVAAVGVGVMAGRLTPADVPVGAGRLGNAALVPTFVRIPSRVETNGKPLSVTLQAGVARAAPVQSPVRYVFIATPPNDAPVTLCDGPAAECLLPLDGSPRGRGTWLLVLRVSDSTGGYAETQARVRVT